MRFVPNRQFVREIATDRQMVSFVEQKAEEALAHFLEFAPERTGDYVRSARAFGTVEDGRAVGRLAVDDFKWHWIEFGTVDTPTFAPLRKALDATSGVRAGGSR